MSLAVLTGDLPAALGNAVSDSLFAAINRGMEVDEACCVAMGVIGDYWRQVYDMDDATVANLLVVLRGRTGPNEAQAGYGASQEAECAKSTDLPDPPVDS